jgi:uncharacterized protein
VASPMMSEVRLLQTRAKLALDRKDHEAAFSLYEELAKLGDLDGKCRLAALYRDMRGDYTSAVDWYRRAAEHGSAEALCMLGYLHRSGQGVQKDDIAAVKCFRKAAELGYCEAEELYAQCLESGIGVQQDLEAAIHWYRRAADHGSAGALVHLGKMFSDGKNDVDFAQAFVYYARAAQLGDPEAQFELGLMYYDGRGITKDIEKALKWLSESSRRGYLVARRVMMYLPEFLERTSVMPQYNGTGVQVKRTQ